MKLPFFSRDSWNMEGVTPPWGDRPSIYEHILENIRPGEPGLDEQGLCFLTMTLHEMAKSFVGRQVHLTECSGITAGIVPSSAASSIAGRLRVHKRGVGL